MRTTTTWSLGLLAMALAGCDGGAAGPSPNVPSSGYAQQRAGASKSEEASRERAGLAPARTPAGGMPSPPAAPPLRETAEAESAPSSGSHWSAPEPKPRERPGLGTEWGETRESHVREVGFVRAEPDRPFAVAELHYDDRAGVEALASWHGGGGYSRFRDVPAANGAITISLRNGWGEAYDAVHAGDRTYVVGQQGERYSIVLTNHTSRRYEAVATVDGLDVINGRPGGLSNRGYLLMPSATLEIDGFRQSDDSVAAFRFAKVKDSYAAQTAGARNVGVIGVAFFAERGDDWSADELRTRDTASPFPRDPRYAPPRQ